MFAVDRRPNANKGSWCREPGSHILQLAPGHRGGSLTEPSPASVNSPTICAVFVTPRTNVLVASGTSMIVRAPAAVRENPCIPCIVRADLTRERYGSPLVADFKVWRLPSHENFCGLASIAISPPLKA